MFRFWLDYRHTDILRVQISERLGSGGSVFIGVRVSHCDAPVYTMLNHIYTPLPLASVNLNYARLRKTRRQRKSECTKNNTVHRALPRDSTCR